MTDNAHVAFLERLPTVKLAEKKVTDIDADDVRGCWCCVRGNRRAFNIELRKLRGAWRFFEYAWLQGGEWCPVESPFVAGRMAPAGSIILNYSDGHRVLVCGRNLRDMYEKLLEHQVKYLAEVDGASDHLAAGDVCVITQIDIAEPTTRDAGSE